MRNKLFGLTIFIITLVSTLSCQRFKDAPLIAQPATFTCSYEVLNTYPHDSNAFTQGLIFEDGDLYESTGLNGRSSIRKVDLATGKVLQQKDLDERYFGEGLTLWQDKLIQLTWLAKTGFVYDHNTFELIETFDYPTQTEGWGLTHNNRELIMSDGSATLYFLDPEKFTVTREIQVKDGRSPVERLNELEYVEGEIYANIWMSDRLARIDPETGTVLGWIDLTGIIEPKPTPERDAVLNGIAYDETEDRLYVTGKLWSKLFEIEAVCR